MRTLQELSKDIDRFSPGALELQPHIFNTWTIREILTFKPFTVCGTLHGPGGKWRVNYSGHVSKTARDMNNLVRLFDGLSNITWALIGAHVYSCLDNAKPAGPEIAFHSCMDDYADMTVAALARTLARTDSGEEYYRMLESLYMGLQSSNDNADTGAQPQKPKDGGIKRKTPKALRDLNIVGDWMCKTWDEFMAHEHDSKMSAKDFDWLLSRKKKRDYTVFIRCLGHLSITIGGMEYTIKYILGLPHDRVSNLDKLLRKHRMNAKRHGQKAQG